MEKDKFMKVRRIAALIGIVLLVSMYVIALIAAMMKSELAHSIFVVSLYSSFVVPVIIYFFQLLYKLKNRDKDEDKK